MVIDFWIIQLFDIIAWILLIISYYNLNTKHILIFHILATILYSLHYYLLDAYSGLYICLFEIARDYLYFATNDEKDRLIFIGSIPVYIVIGVLTFKDILGLFPLFASLMAGWSLTKKRNIIVFCAIIEYILWVIYDLTVRSYAGAVTDGLVALANIILLCKKDFFKEEKLESIFNK